jgi:hypothetical protein
MTKVPGQVKAVDGAEGHGPVLDGHSAPVASGWCLDALVWAVVRPSAEERMPPTKWQPWVRSSGNQGLSQSSLSNMPRSP